MSSRHQADQNPGKSGDSENVAVIRWQTNACLAWPLDSIKFAELKFLQNRPIVLFWNDITEDSAFRRTV